MAEKSDQDIINEVGLEASNNEITDEEALKGLSIEDDDTNDILEPIEDSLEPVKKDKLNNNDAIENEDKDDEKELIDDSDDKKTGPILIQKKQPKIYKILIGIASFLFLLLTIGAILYFIGFFNPKPVNEPMKKIQEKVQSEIEFDEKNINKTKLNKKLTMLTKKEIMNKDELEAEENKIKEEERKKKEEEKKVLEDKKRKEAESLAAQFNKIEAEKKLLLEHQEKIKKEQESFLKIQENVAKEFEEKRAQLLLDIENQRNIIPPEPEYIEEPIMEEEAVEEESQEIVKEDNTKTFLSFINVATIKGDLYKSFLDKVMSYNKDVSLCRDYKNRIEIYFGPYESKIERAKVLKNLNDNGFKESYMVNFTQEEYEKRCKY